MLIGNEDNTNEDLLNLGDKRVVCFFKVARGIFNKRPIMPSESIIK